MILEIRIAAGTKGFLFVSMAFVPIYFSFLEMLNNDIAKLLIILLRKCEPKIATNALEKLVDPTGQTKTVQLIKQPNATYLIAPHSANDFSNFFCQFWILDFLIRASP